MYRNLKKIGSIDYISEYKSKGLSDESINLLIHLIIVLLQL